MSQCVNTVLDGTHQEDVDNRIAKMEKESPLHTPLCFSKLNYDLHRNLDLPDGIESYSWNFFFSISVRQERDGKRGGGAHGKAIQVEAPPDARLHSLSPGGCDFTFLNEIRF